MDYIKYYKVVAKCGHVGRNNYIPIVFAVRAICGEDAAKIVRRFPRVKHHKKDAILSCLEINNYEYEIIKENNKNDEYLKCHSRQEQNKINNLEKRILLEAQKEKKKRNRLEVYEKYKYKMNKFKEKEKVALTEYGYLY